MSHYFAEAMFAPVLLSPVLTDDRTISVKIEKIENTVGTTQWDHV